MAVSKAKKKSATKPKKEESKVKTEKPVQKSEAVAVEVKPEPVKSEPVKSEPVKPEPVSLQKNTKALVLKHKIGDVVSFQGKMWKVLVVVDKKQRERLRIEHEGVRKAIWLEDLD